MRTRPLPLVLLVVVLLVHGFAAWHRYELDEWTHGLDPAAWVFLWVWLHDLSVAAVTAVMVLLALTLWRRN